MPQHFCRDCGYAIRYEVIKPTSCPSCATPTKSISLMSTAAIAPRPRAVLEPLPPLDDALAASQGFEDNEGGGDGEDAYDPRAKADLKRQLIARLQSSGGIRVTGGDDDDAPVKLGDLVGRPKAS